jgi:hypothetical protein
MLAAMVVWMLVTGAIFLSIVGLKTWDEVTLQYPTQPPNRLSAGEAGRPSPPPAPSPMHQRPV